MGIGKQVMLSFLITWILVQRLPLPIPRVQVLTNTNKREAVLAQAR
jgi:hypothetical protein